MNLIEQLGGYEKAKNHRDYLASYGSEFAGVSQKEINELNTALLKYRRQHNIFEVGDKVVSKNGCELVSEITYLQGGLAKIKNEKFDHVYSLQDFRHAEPEEIKAGKRLEVNQ